MGPLSSPLSTTMARLPDTAIEKGRLVNQAMQPTDPPCRCWPNPVAGRLNVWGEPGERGDAVAPDAISPFYAKRGGNDPVKCQRARLQATLSKPERFHHGG